MAKKPFTVIQVLDLSTCHLPSATAVVDAALLAAPYEHGWFIYMDADAQAGELTDGSYGYPQWYVTLAKWAQSFNFDWVRFDADGITRDDLPVYEW